MRLNVGVLSLKKLTKTVNRNLLDLVHHLTTAVIPSSGITLGVFVRAHRPKRLKYLRADIVLGGNQFQARSLPVLFLFDKSEFNYRYVTPIMEREDKTVEKRLKSQIYPFILRRMKRDVAKDLPDKIENDAY